MKEESAGNKREGEKEGGWEIAIVEWEIKTSMHDYWQEEAKALQRSCVYMKGD